MVNQLQKKNNIDTSVFVLKTEYNTDKSDSEKKIGDAEKRIPKINELVKKKWKRKYQVSLLWLLVLYCLQLKVRYLMLVIQSSKQIMTQRYQKWN